VSERWSSVKSSVRSGFWAIPAACVLVAVLLAFGLVSLDRYLTSRVAYTFGAGPDGAREVLGAITTAMITFTGLVFSITIVVLQLTSSQFSPRVLRTFLRDRLIQASLGVFVATFVYAVTVLRTVDSADGTVFVPEIATTVGLVLLLLSVAMFVGYIHHIATTIQVSSIIGAIGKEARQTLETRFPSGTDVAPDAGPVRRPDGLPSAMVPARRSGVVTTIGEQRLVALACQADVVLTTRLRFGDFVPEGAPLLEVLGDPSDLDLAAVSACFGQARERTMEQDLAFGFRQLVDIAEKALSPGINDPTTAVQALDQVHDLLRRLATRPLRSGVHTDALGRVRLVVPEQQMADFLSLALDEVEDYGKDARAVQSRIASLLDDLAAAALPQHRGAVEQRRAAR